MTAAQNATASLPAHRVRSRPPLDSILVHRLSVLVTLGGVTGLYALFALTALRFQEWPHRPGDHGFSSCAKASFFEIGDPCVGTFDPSGYGVLSVSVLFLIMATPLAALIWMPASLALKGKADQRQRAWNIAFALAVISFAVTVAFDPLGAMVWFLD